MSRLSDVEKKYPNLNWNFLKDADPSPNYKYLDWLGKNAVLLPGIPGHAIDDIRSKLIKFENNKDKLEKKDIYNYTFITLTETLNALKFSRKENKELGTIELDEVNETKIILLEGEEAVKQYCAGTRWCISNLHTFINYSRESNLFLLIRNNVKLMLLVNLRRGYVRLYNPKDHLINLQDDNHLYDFLNTYYLLPLKEVITYCQDFSKIYRNWWAQNLKQKTSREDFFFKLENITKESSSILFYLGYKLSKQQVNYIYKNQSQFPKLAKYIPKLSDRNKIKQYWNFFALPKESQNKKQHEILLKKIKKMGGMKFVLNNKAIARVIQKELGAIK